METPTPNALVSAHVAHARKQRGWRQRDLADRLSEVTGRPWSINAVQWAESTTRTRQWSADEIVALAVVFGVPLIAFFLPADQTKEIITGATTLSVEQYKDAVLPPFSTDENLRSLRAEVTDLQRQANELMSKVTTTMGGGRSGKKP